MKCPTCGGEDSHIIKTTAQDDLIRRSRQCDKCGYRWSTVEIPADFHKRASRALETLDLAGAIGRSVAVATMTVHDPETHHEVALPIQPGWMAWLEEHADDIFLPAATLCTFAVQVRPMDPFIHTGPGVYFLVFQGAIVYVGMSLNSVQIRVGQHLRDALPWSEAKGKVFDAVAWIACPPEHAPGIEKVYINLLRPQYNEYIPPVPEGYQRFFSALATVDDAA